MTLNRLELDLYKLLLFSSDLRLQVVLLMEVCPGGPSSESILEPHTEDGLCECHLKSHKFTKTIVNSYMNSAFIKVLATSDDGGQLYCRTQGASWWFFKNIFSPSTSRFCFSANPPTITRPGTARIGEDSLAVCTSSCATAPKMRLAAVFFGTSGAAKLLGHAESWLPHCRTHVSYFVHRFPLWMLHQFYSILFYRKFNAIQFYFCILYSAFNYHFGNRCLSPSFSSCILSTYLWLGRLNVAASSLTERLACELVRMSILCRFFGLLCRECSHRKVNTQQLTELYFKYFILLLLYSSPNHFQNPT